MVININFQTGAFCDVANDTCTVQYLYSGRPKLIDLTHKIGGGGRASYGLKFWGGETGHFQIAVLPISAMVTQFWSIKIWRIKSTSSGHPVYVQLVHWYLFRFGMASTSQSLSSSLVFISGISSMSPQFISLFLKSRLTKNREGRNTPSKT